MGKLVSGAEIVFKALEDQNVDYDNSVRGFSLSYYLNENLKF